MYKQDFRKKLIAERKTLSAGETEYRSQLIYKNFLSNMESLVSSELKSVAFYYPIRGEVDTRPLFRFFSSRQKTCLFPRIHSDAMTFHPIHDWSELQIGTFGIAEPQPLPGATALCPDLVIVPGVAFSMDLHRLGFGAGYYDRAIASWIDQGARNSLRLVGLAYDFQLLPSLPSEAHDHPMDFVITESQFLYKASAA